MIIPPFSALPCAVSSGARCSSDRRSFRISTGAGYGSLPAILLTLTLCFWAPFRECAAVDFHVFKNFTATDGAHPFSDLVQGTDGKLYGTTTTGNNSTDHDTIFRINTDGTGFTVLKNLDSATTGGNCWTGLLLGSDGMLYGTAYYGGTGGDGTIFKLNQDGTGFVVLKNFNAATTGGSPYAKLIQGGDGVLYGTTFAGGTGNAGTVFKLNPDGSGFTVLKHFATSTTGGSPTAPVTLGADGVLYGTASYGSSTFQGTIFKLNTDGSDFIVIHELDADSTGAFPQAGLLLGSDGALYGSTSAGGDFQAGTIFKVTFGEKFYLLKSLDSFADGEAPCGSLIEGESGKLYGTTLHGGSHGMGVVFEMNPDGSEYRTVKRFDNATTGSFLFAGLMQGSDGALYGAAGYGGSGDYGTLFRLWPTENGAPTAVAGPNQTIPAGGTVYLDGSASFDDDTTPSSLAYAWSFTSIPIGSTATLDSANTATPTFATDLTGAYFIQLIVTDEDGVSSAPKTMRVKALEGEDP
jgi:uncharacterized repeat protein (TIGR03803 family)